MNTRKIVKKRPQSATRKNLMQGALLAANKHGQHHHMIAGGQTSFKSPQTTFTVKKTSLTRGNAAAEHMLQQHS